MRNDHSHINVCLFVERKTTDDNKMHNAKHWNILQTISMEDNRENVNLLLLNNINTAFFRVRCHNVSELCYNYFCL